MNRHFRIENYIGEWRLYTHKAHHITRVKERFGSSKVRLPTTTRCICCYALNLKYTFQNAIYSISLS